MPQGSASPSRSDLFLTLQERERLYGPAPVKVRRSYTISPAVKARCAARHQQNAARDRKIIEAHRQLRSVRKTAALFGLSFQRVQAIVARGV